MNEISCSDIVKILKKAKWILGEEFKNILPEGMKITIDSHDTASHCYIYLTMPESPDLLIWYKTNWCSSSYEFNEIGKIVGTQLECQFADPLIEKLIQDCQKIVDDYDKRIDQEKHKELALKEVKKEMLIDRYKRKFQ